MARRGMRPWGDPGKRPGRRPAGLPSPSIRLTDTERDEAMARLSEHYAVGRLDKEEFDERSDAVWTARTGADLVPIFADLEPAPRPPRSPRDWYGRLPVPLVVVLVLIALTAITHVPFVLLAFFGVFVFGRGRGRRW